MFKSVFLVAQPDTWISGRTLGTRWILDKKKNPVDYKVKIIHIFCILLSFLTLYFLSPDFVFLLNRGV